MQSNLLKNLAKPLILGSSIAALSTMSLSNAYADNVAIPTATPIGQQGSNNTVKRPHNGLKKADVERLYGNPISRKSAVGHPPISSWVYADYTVYFEYNVVIHSVLTR